MAKWYYINIEWQKGNTDTLEKCSEVNKKEAFWDYQNKYGEDYRVWCSTRPTKQYLEKFKKLLTQSSE